ncbi:hypothetical protein C8Q78DRAFT_1083786 [Trametes maxima]|nr:hypothetical protein C8Q78DRAFT_1083786 [Trametes maxima]
MNDSSSEDRAIYAESGGLRANAGDATPLSRLDNTPFDQGSANKPLPETPSHTIPQLASKRQHALLELVSSERAYASHLAFIRDVSIPLALGQPIPALSERLRSSFRTMSIVSDISSSYSLLSGEPAMAPNDAKIVFGNIAELASFSTNFVEDLDKALGDVLEPEGNPASDRVGSVFLARIPTLQALYHTYITKQPAAIEHLAKLPRTAALDVYSTQTWVLAFNMSNVRDLPSLLFKPVQRLLQYAPLLSTLFYETPLTHPDKGSLRKARAKIEEIALTANESRTRRATIRAVLTEPVGMVLSKYRGAVVKEKESKLRPTAPLSNAAHPWEVPGLKDSSALDVDSTEVVKRLGLAVSGHRDVIQRLIGDIFQWLSSISTLTDALGRWETTFARVVLLDSAEDLEATAAFRTLVRQHLPSICDDVKIGSQKLIQLQLAQLHHTVQPVSHLLEVMHRLEHSHHRFVNLTAPQKSRASLQLSEASRIYTALRVQLFTELPKCLRLLENGIGLCILNFASLQRHFYKSIREQWMSLWDTLRRDEETDFSAKETCTVWKSRFGEVETFLTNLGIVTSDWTILGADLFERHTMGRTLVTGDIASSAVHNDSSGGPDTSTEDLAAPPAIEKEGGYETYTRYSFDGTGEGELPLKPGQRIEILHDKDAA